MKTTQENTSKKEQTPKANLMSARLRSVRPQKSMIRIKSLKPQRIEIARKVLKKTSL